MRSITTLLMTCALGVGLATLGPGCASKDGSARTQDSGFSAGTFAAAGSGGSAAGSGVSGTFAAGAGGTLAAGSGGSAGTSITPDGGVVGSTDGGDQLPGDAAEDAAIPDYDAGMIVPSSAGYLHTDGAKILNASNQEVRITGLSWFGMETSNYAPHGLWTRSLASMLDQIKQLGYNTIRLPFCSQLFDSGSTPNGIDNSKNADLMNIGGLALMDKIVAGAQSRGLKIILDRHRPDSNAQSELWYTAQYSEQRLIDDWKMLAMHYKGNATVIGFDLHNEPHGMATWGDGNMATDWRLAAERIGNAVLSVNSDLLIIVEGIEKYQNTPGWWGGNLRGVKQYPVQLSIAQRLVYSVHDYPASVYNQPWFTDANYPSNLSGVWHDEWGYVMDENIAPVWLGEFGTKYQTDVDQKWLQTLATYIGQKHMSFAYWCLNPDSGDTGGILQDDWMSVNQDKQSVIAPVLAPLIQ